MYTGVIILLLLFSLLLFLLLNIYLSLETVHVCHLKSEVQREWWYKYISGSCRFILDLVILHSMLKGQQMSNHSESH
jgi:hypothetical protein